MNIIQEIKQDIIKGPREEYDYEAGKKCKNCGKNFKPMRANQLTCSQDCGKERHSKRMYKINVINRNKKAAKLHFIKNELSKQKYKYSDKIIDYPDCPTGRAYIGMSKQPLMKNDNGIGFKGTKLQSENRELIQCYGCGDWFRKIVQKHTLKCCGLTIKEYKGKFGFNKTTSLISDIASNEAAARIVHNSKIRENMKNKGKYLKPGKKKGGKYRTVEMENYWGTCPEQLESALVEYIHRFKRLPSSQSGNRGFGKLGAFLRRFGSFNNALRHYGLPTRKRMGQITEYNFPNNTQYFIKNGMGYEELYRLMCAKCSILKQ